MSLIKFGREDQIKDGERIVKECWDRCLALVKLNGEFMCYELPDTSFAESDVDKLPSIEGVKTHSVVKDDGYIWVTLRAEPAKPVVDRSFNPPSQESIENLTAADVPPALQPFAGRQQAPMPPSPAKPFSVPASPLKPSPFKERVDAATKAVALKMPQAKRGNMFGAPAKKPVAAGGDA